MPGSAVFTLARLITLNSAFCRQHFLGLGSAECSPGMPRVSLRLSRDAAACSWDLMDHVQLLLLSHLAPLEDQVLGDLLRLLQ